MNAIKKYNQLDGKVIERKLLKEIHRGLFELLPEKPFVKNAWTKLGNLLSKFPNNKRFDIVISKPIAQPKGLKGMKNAMAIIQVLKEDKEYISHEKIVGGFKGKKEANIHIYTNKRYKGTSNSWGLQSFSSENGHGLLIPVPLNAKTKRKSTRNTVEKRAKKATRQKKGTGLNGDLKPVPNLEKERQIPKGTLSVNDFLDRKFNPVKVKDKWKKIIGDFELPTHILLVGGGGNGKSGMALEFAEDMTELGYKVLFASPEQFYSPTFGSLLRDVGISPDNNNLIFSPHYLTKEYNPSMFDIVILDSKDSFELSNPSEFEYLTKTYPKTSFIIMSQANKDGSFSGSGKWRNVVDTILEAHERGKMRTGIKNRWNQYGEITLFDSENEHENDLT